MVYHHKGQSFSKSRLSIYYISALSVCAHLDTPLPSTRPSASEYKDAYLCPVTLSYRRHPVPAVSLPLDTQKCGPAATSSMQCTATTA